MLDRTIVWREIIFCITPNWVNPWLKSFKNKTIARYRPICHTSIWAPTGVAGNAKLAGRFLQRKMAEYERLREEIEALQLEADQPLPSVLENSGK